MRRRPRGDDRLDGARVPRRRVAGRPDLDAAELAARPQAAGDLDIAGHADAEHPGLAGRPPPGLLGAQVVVPRRRQHPVERPGVVAAVVGRARRRRARLGERRQQVAAPHLDRVEADLGGEQVDGPLDGRGRLGTPGASVRPDRRRGGQRHAGVGRHGGDGVGAGRHRPGEVGQEGGHRRVGAGVLDDVEVVGLDRAVAAAADRDLVDLRAAVDHGGHVLGAGLGPPHRAPAPPGQPAEHDVLGVAADLGAETAADVGGDDPHPVLVQPVGRRHRVAQAVGVLGRAPQHEPPVHPGGSGRPTLQRGRRQPLVDDALAHHDVAARSPSGDAGPALLAEGRDQVRAQLGEEDRLAGEPLDRVDDHRQRLVVDHHPLRGVRPLLGGLAEHDGHRLADEADAVRRQQRPGHRPVGHARHGRQVDLGPRDDVHDAGQAARLGDVHPDHQGVRHRRAQERGVHRALEGRLAEVGGVATTLGQQAGVLDARDTRAEDAHERVVSRA